MGSVRAALNYSVDNGRPIDYYFYDPGPDLELNPPGTDTREMEIRDGWPMADSFSVDGEGFEIGASAAASPTSTTTQRSWLLSTRKSSTS